MLYPAHETLALITYVQKPPLITHADVSGETRGLNLGLVLYLHQYFAYASSESSSQSVYLCRLA